MAALFTKEVAWFKSDDERLLGVVTHDLHDGDYGWVALGRDERLRYRGVAGAVSLSSLETARDALAAELSVLAVNGAAAFSQGDWCGTPPVDFFEPLPKAAGRLHATFRTLIEDPRYSPARDLIAAMMRFHEDADGNFVEQFQTAGFDARLWELYLFAAFNELNFAADPEVPVPDFLLSSPVGHLGIEATTINPAQDGSDFRPTNRVEFGHFLHEFVPVRLARVLRRKLEKKTPYWSLPQMSGVPFVLAVQDFHAPGTMRYLTPAATEYAFGVRHRRIDGHLSVERIEAHRHGARVEKSGFFFLPGAEHVSAVFLNPLGTMPKFNRIGYIAGFGDRRVRMVRTGLRRGELDPDGPMPKPFAQLVHAPDYSETWVEGAVVLHNPRAVVPLDPQLIPGAAHEFLQEDGSIMSLLPTFHPYTSQTQVALDEHGGKS